VSAVSPLTSHVFAKPLSALLIAGQMSLSIPVAAADDAAPQAAAPTAAAPPQTIAPTVKVNRTVPAVTAAPLMPRFSAEPTDEEITRARVFDEPIMPMPGAGSASENRTLADAILAYLDAGGGDRLDALRRFLGVYPDSRWRASLLTGMGVSYRRTGHFSRALAAWEEAWSLAKESEDARIKATADRAVGELFELNARLGRFNVLERLFEEIGDRDIRGSATEKVSGARQALWLMHNRTGEAFRCGPLAIYSILRAAQPELLQPKPIEMCKSTKQGTSLLQLRDLSIEVGRPMLMARRDPGSHVYTPSVVHWKVGHFAALVAADEDRYLVQDPTFGDEFWVSQATLDEEASGYFLIPEGILVPGWVRVDDQTGATLWGKGAPAGVDSTDVGDEPECPTCPTGGMGPGRGLAVASIHMMLASIRLKDIPVGYSPPVGPSSDFRVTYNQRETFQPQTFYYSNLGPKWTPDWLSYIEDDPGNPSAALTIYKRNGGRETSTSFNSATQSYAPTVRSQAVVKRVSASPIAYERELPDGLIEVFTQPDGAMTSPRKVFLTAIKDPAGNALTFTYDGSLRLVAATDAIGQVTTIAYEHADPLKITKVTDPFGRSATFEYDGGGRLQRITDVLGLQSSLTYGAGDVVKTLTTPYGTTTFTSGEVGIRRWAELTDPSGGKERVEYGFGLSYSDPANLVPSGMNTINAALDHHNTLYWDKRAMAVAPGERWAATDYHWALISTGAYQASAVPLSVKRPLEHRTWFNYHGGGGNTEGTLRKLTAIGRVNHRGPRSSGNSHITFAADSRAPKIQPGELQPTSTPATQSTRSKCVAARAPHQR
jgi:YD repeat-containing protein